MRWPNQISIFSWKSLTLRIQKHWPERVGKSDFQKVKTEHFRAFVPEDLQSVERQDVLRTVMLNWDFWSRRVCRSAWFYTFFRLILFDLASSHHSKNEIKSVTFRRKSVTFATKIRKHFKSIPLVYTILIVELTVYLIVTL